MARNFRIQIVDIASNEVAVEYPLPNQVIHNGLGGGTETLIPDTPEKIQIASLFKQMTTAWKDAKQGELVAPASIMDRPVGQLNITPSAYSEPCDQCPYIAKGRSGALAAAQLKLHKKYKHSGVKVGSGK
jgi:hypothetical protein